MIKANTKIGNSIEWIKRNNNVQENAYVVHKDVKIFSDTTQFNSFKICGQHTKPNDVRGVEYAILYVIRSKNST